jgi:phosphate transport system protein
MQETRKAYHSDLEEVRSRIVRLGASVIEAIPRATNVLLTGDLEGADYLVQSDDEIDARADEIEDRSFELLALQAPVAGELRQIVAILKITSDLERSADLTVNICKAARRIYGKEIDPVLRGLISKMSEQAQQLYQAAINSFAENDAATAAAVEDMDAFLDALHRQFIQAIFESHARERMDLQLAVQLAIVARFYERIGDHAVNVSERVRFALTGWKPELRAIARQRQREATGELPITRG